MGGSDGGHYPRLDEITPMQREKLTELRSKTADYLARYPEYDTDFDLLRWLLGWDYKIDEIVPRLKFAIDTLLASGAADLDAKDEHQVNNYVRNMYTCSPYFPGGIMGYDRDGNIIYMQCIADIHPKELVKSGSAANLFIQCVHEIELTMKLMRREEKKRGCKLGAICILDMDQFNMDMIYMPAIKIYMELITLMQRLFPDLGRKIYIVNCPSMISAVYAIISPALAKQTKEKVNFIGSNWKEVLVNDLGAENIYRRWGGTKASESDCGDLRMGGKATEKIWYNPDTNAFDNKDDMTKLSVAARTRGELRLQGRAGKEFRWLWRVSSGDLDFWIEFNGRVVYPKMRLSTEFVPENGRLQCENSGEYVFYFDNSHGKIFGKDIKYRIEIV